MGSVLGMVNVFYIFCSNFGCAFASCMYDRLLLGEVRSVALLASVLVRHHFIVFQCEKCESMNTASDCGTS